MGALSADWAETSGAGGNALVGVDESVVADTDSVDWAGSGWASSDAGLTDEVEPSDACLADGRSRAAGLAGV